MENVILKEYVIRDQLLQVMMDNDGSDMYLTVGTFPAVKIGGEILRIDEGLTEFTTTDTENFSKSIITELQHEELLREKNLDFAFSFNGRRFRCNISFQMGKYMIVLRLLNSYIPSVDDLGLSDIYKDITKLGQGLILVTGPTGSGKSTTLAAMINHININYNRHIITIEDPVEYIHEHKKSIIEQKEIGSDVLSYEKALMGAMRQNPQVILFGEMRTKKEIEMGLTLAETGHLVFSTLHTRNAHQTITRIIDSFEGPEQTQIRLQLSESLVGVFSQRLLKKHDGTGVVLAREILLKNNAVSNLIRENDLHQIPSVMQMSSREGMQLLEKDLITYINRGIITMEEGLKYANNPKIVKDGVQIEN